MNRWKTLAQNGVPLSLTCHVGELSSILLAYAATHHQGHEEEFANGVELVLQKGEQLLKDILIYVSIVKDMFDFDWEDETLEDAVEFYLNNTEGVMPDFS